MVKRCFVIAEAGVNHNGSVALAKELVDVAAASGADAVKFQTFKAEKLVVPNTPTAAYQKKQTGTDSQFDLLKGLELSQEDYQEIVSYCEEKNIEFMSTGFDEECLAYVVSLGVKRLKIPSGEITNHSLLRAFAGYNLPLILSTGMSTLEEVKEAVACIQATGFKQSLSVLHCTSNYPTALKDVNLLAMKTMQKALNLPVGYSDHTPGIFIAPLAVSLGATVIEKHFTIDKNLPGPDHQASLEPSELMAMIQAIRDAELALGDGVKAPTESEIPVRDLVRKSLVIHRAMKKDDVIQKDDMICLRPGTGISAKDFEVFVGKKVKHEIAPMTLLKEEDVFDA